MKTSEEWADEIREERELLRDIQSKNVMPIIGSLLDAWENVPLDLREDEELERVAYWIEQIRSRMEDDEWFEEMDDEDENK